MIKIKIREIRKITVDKSNRDNSFNMFDVSGAQSSPMCNEGFFFILNTRFLSMYAFPSQYYRIDIYYGWFFDSAAEICTLCQYLVSISRLFRIPEFIGLNLVRHVFFTWCDKWSINDKWPPQKRNTISSGHPSITPKTTLEYKCKIVYLYILWHTMDSN